MNKTTNLVFSLKAMSKNMSISVEEVDVPQSLVSTTFKHLSKAQKTFLSSKGVTIPTDNIITKNYKSTVSSSVVNTNKANEVTIFDISAVTPFDKEVTVAKISIRAIDNKKILNKPSLNLVSGIVNSNVSKNLNFKLKTTSTIKDSNNVVTGYDLDIIYIGSKEISSSDGVILKLRTNIIKKISRAKSINKVVFGRNHIKTHGEERDIKIYGIPFTNFTLTIKNSDGDSILENPNSQTEDDSGASIFCITDVIPRNGVYVYKQTFPQIPEIKSTAVNGSMAASGASKVIFDDLSDVQVGDQLFVVESTRNNRLKSIKVLELDPDGDNANECSLSQNLKAADDTSVIFRTSTTYSIHVTTTDTLNSNLPTTTPMYTLNQYTDPLLTIRATTDSRDYLINSQALPAAGGQTYDLYYTGRALEKNDNLNKTNFPRQYSLSYLLDRVDSDALSVTKTPEFSDTIEFPDTTVENSDWTNTDPLENGGTSVSINHLAPVLSTADSVANNACTISFELQIREWGNEDVIMEIDLDNIIGT